MDLNCERSAAVTSYMSPARAAGFRDLVRPSDLLEIREIEILSTSQKTLLLIESLQDAASAGYKA